MKSGTYQVTFDVSLIDCEDESEAVESIKEMISNAMDRDLFPELHFELTEETYPEYSVDEDELKELEF